MVRVVVAVDPGEDGVDAGRDETEREEVAVGVRPLVRRVRELDDAALARSPLVRHRFCKRRDHFGMTYACMSEML